MSDFGDDVGQMLYNLASQGGREGWRSWWNKMKEIDFNKAKVFAEGQYDKDKTRLDEYAERTGNEKTIAVCDLNDADVANAVVSGCNARGIEVEIPEGLPTVIQYLDDDATEVRAVAGEVIARLAVDKGVPQKEIEVHFQEYGPFQTADGLKDEWHVAKDKEQASLPVVDKRDVDLTARIQEAREACADLNNRVGKSQDKLIEVQAVR
jgi:hypothetical protein